MWRWALSKLDPFLIPMPPKWANDPELEPTIRYLWLWLQDAYIKLGGGEDLITNITNSESFETSSSATVKEFTAKIASSAYTAVDHDFVEGRSSVTIKLDANASYNDQIITGNGDGSDITIDGDGIILRHSGLRVSTLILQNEGTSIHWYLFVDGGEKYWRSS